MELYPAIDLIGGKCVRLMRGSFDDVTTYERAPVDVLRENAKAGAAWTHIVDLDGAKAGAPRQHDLLCELAGMSLQKLQVAGGVRTADHVDRLLKAGAARVVIGSMAVKDPAATSEWLRHFGGDALTIALDVRLIDGEPMVATHGWREQSDISLWSAIDALEEAGLTHILVTDIDRDGAMTGPNVGLIEKIVTTRPSLQVQASGGVSSAGDLRALKAAGAHGAIVGKALYEKALTLAEALDACA